MARVVHFEIHAADTDRARLFYHAVFGWDAKQWGEVPYWLIETGKPEERGIDGAMVLRQGPDPQPGEPVNAFVCTVAVDDLDATMELAMDAGGDTAMPRMAVPGVGWLAYLHDTEGNIFGVLQPDESAA